jgi:hypothetical protein
METRESRSSGNCGGPCVPQPRATYVAPILVEYGNVSKLTEAAGSANGDAGQNMMPGCL